MATIPTSESMENPLGDLDPADLLKQGVAEDTLMDGATSSFNPPSVEELAKIFPQFEILELIGQGGMGAVYKVRQKDLDRVVALKILPPGIGQTPEFSNRFTREARALAKLNHPGIVTLHEFGQLDGLYFILMELVDGVNLAQLMKTGRVSPREALAIVPQICDALQFAHDQGIIHRDIKPENILLDRLGRVKVADFGIAKVVAAVCEDPIRSGDIPVPADQTLAGKIIGTPQYMAPEQISHPAEVDHRADIYALGVVFYQMLTGELPGKRLEAPSKKVLIDVRLDEIVMRAMEKEPEMRYQTAHEFRTVVDGVQAPAQALPPSLSPSPPKRGMLRWWWVFLIMFPLGLLIGLAAAAVLAYVTPKKYEVSAIIEVKPAAGSVMPPNIFGSQFEALKSKKTMEAIAERLELPKKWMLSQDAVVQKLRHITTTQNIRGTDLISIRVRHTDQKEAAAIVSLVTQQYQRSFSGEVVVHEEPSDTETPSSPNVWLNLLIGGLLGLILSPLLAIILIVILQRLFPETKSINSPNLGRAKKSGPKVKKLSTLSVILLILFSIFTLIPSIAGTIAFFWYQFSEPWIVRHLSSQNGDVPISRTSEEKSSSGRTDIQVHHPLLMTEFGEFKSEQSLWSISVSAQDQTLHISRQPGSSGVGVSMSPDRWRAQEGWFAFIEDENHAWAYDGGEKLMLVEVTREKSTLYETETIPRTVPEFILPRISQSTRDKIGIKSTPESRRLANRLSETEVAVLAARRQAGIAAGNHGEGRNDAARFFPSAITESAWVVPLGFVLSLLLAIILIAILRRLFPQTKSINFPRRASQPASVMKTQVDSFSIASFLMAILLGPLGSLPAIIFGHVSLSRMRANPLLTGRGFAVAGLMIGYLFLTASIALIAVAMVFYGKTTESGFFPSSGEMPFPTPRAIIIEEPPSPSSTADTPPPAPRRNHEQVFAPYSPDKVILASLEPWGFIADVPEGFDLTPQNAWVDSLRKIPDVDLHDDVGSTGMSGITLRQNDNWDKSARQNKPDFARVDLVSEFRAGKVDFRGEIKEGGNQRLTEIQGSLALDQRTVIKLGSGPEKRQRYLVLWFSSATHLAKKSPEQMDKDREHALEWLSLLDRGEYSKASAATKQDGFSGFGLNEAEWIAVLTEIRKPRGAVISRAFKSSFEPGGLVGAVSGTYRLMQFETVFSDGTKTVESITFSKERDYTWKVVAYFIDSASGADSPTGVGLGGPEIAVLAATWIAGIDAGKYSQSWQDASVFFRSAITEAAWVSALEKTRKQLGAVKSREIRDLKKANKLPDAPDGEYLVIQFDTSFAAKEKAVETVTFMREKDGWWKAAGYFIR